MAVNPNSGLSCPHMDMAAIYRVQSGDNLWQIKNACNIQDDSSMKPVKGSVTLLPNINLIYPNDPVCVPVTCPILMKGCPMDKQVMVKAGDYLYKIATDKGKTLEQIELANPQILNYDWIYPDQPICLERGTTVVARRSNGSSRRN